MKKRFSSLNIVDLAAWLLAMATYGCLAAAGLAMEWGGKLDLRDAVGSKPNPTAGA